MNRTHYCGVITSKNLGETVTVCGWVHSRRDHGGVVFIDLRDREGLVQIVFRSENKELLARAETLRPEFVIEITGQVQKRPAGTENPKLNTGEIEVVVDKLTILNTSEALPFEISEFQNVGEELRLKYRYLDLRQKKLKQNIELRSKLMQVARNYFIENGFNEIETPFLTKSTPEGARDFLVPSRMTPGAFYALPQSPQLFKQLLMVSGFDKYFQVVRCFRDEDLRADRQPEFTQIDVEQSFVEEDDIIALIEKFLAKIMKTAMDIDIEIPFRRMDYSEAMTKYGSDKPDLRFGLEIGQLSDKLKDTQFKVFRDTIANGGIVCGLCVSNEGNKYSRQYLDNLKEIVAPFGAKGLAWIKVSEKGYESPIAKFLTPEELEAIRKTFNAPNDSVIFFVADKKEVVYPSLGALRLHVAKESGLLKDKTDKFSFVWIVNFPLLEWNKDEKKFVSMHHPFTMPREKDLPILNEIVNSGDMSSSKAEDIHARAYDIVLNGTELGGGSIRIHKTELQKNIFKLLNIPDDAAVERFGFLLEALKYGAPPHGGIALGFDRLIAILSGEDSIRDVIAFPKTQKGLCPLSGAPAQVNEKQLKELSIKIVLISLILVLSANLSLPFAKEKIHKVWIWQETGDSLWNIAKKYYGDGRKWTYIYDANKDIIKDPRKIFPKQKLIIPSLEEISQEEASGQQPEINTTILEAETTETAEPVQSIETEIIEKEEPAAKITDEEKQKALKALEEMEE